MTRIRNASKDTLFGKADSKLSDMASQLLQINRSEDEAYEDMRIFHAPSECAVPVHRSYNNLRNKLFEEYEMTRDEFFDKIEERTSGKWLYFHSNLLYDF